MPVMLADAQRVILVGMMGSGKSSVGRLLSAATRWPYHDNDELVRRLFGVTAREILAVSGEATMRAAELQALALGLESAPPCIVGAAAGTILEEDARQRLRNAGCVVWLRARPETLTRRAVGADHRPWLDSGGVEWIRDAALAREPLYASVADVTVDTDERSAGEVTREISERLAAIGFVMPVREPP